MHSLQKVLNAAENSAVTRNAKYRVQELVFADGYSEPGYPDCPNGLILGDWNNVSHWDEDKHGFIVDDETMPRLCEILEHMEIETDWSDEYVICGECQNAVRCVADSYGWTRSYWDDEGEIVCHECLLGDEGLIRGYLESIEGDEGRADTLDIYLVDYGWRCLDEDFQNGLYGGQCADPKVIAESLREQGEERFIFQIDSVGQFDMRFSVWVPTESKVDAVDNTDSVDPAEMMKKAFKSIPSTPQPSEGIKYTTLNLKDGTSETRIVSPEEFAKGIKP